MGGVRGGEGFTILTRVVKCQKTATRYTIFIFVKTDGVINSQLSQQISFYIVYPVSLVIMFYLQCSYYFLVQ